MSEIYAKKCVCGAVTVDYVNEDGEQISSSIPEDLFHIYFPCAEIEEEEYHSCNYCINHYGIDLCACGSGMKVDECNEGFEVCGTPAQQIGVRQPSIIEVIAERGYF